VGDVVKVLKDEFFPAPPSSPAPTLTASADLETMNLDGETNPKLRQSARAYIRL